MRKTVTLETNSADKIYLLLKIAHEMGINALVNELSEEDKEWQKLSEQTLEKDWLRPEEDIWDNFIKARLKK